MANSIATTAANGILKKPSRNPQLKAPGVTHEKKTAASDAVTAGSSHMIGMSKACGTTM